MTEISPLTFDEFELTGSLAKRFGRVVAAYPDRSAVVSDQYTWTFAELDRRARSVARVVFSRFGELSEPVALLMEHDAPLVAAILGILQAGKFYCSLDPTLPVGRLAANLADLQPRLMITDAIYRPLAEKITQPGIEILEIDQADDVALDDLPGVSQPAEAPAAIFFTTGTTGRPKGVVRNHGLILHRAWLEANELAITPDDRRTMLTTTSFPASVSDIMGVLLTGGSIHPYSLKLRGAVGLNTWIRRHAITVLRPPISFFRQFLNLLGDGVVLETVRLVILSGDVLYKTDLEQAFQHFRPDCLYHHHYASSEAGIVAGSLFTKDTQIESAIVPVGYPAEGKTVVLLDNDNLPALPGQAGEIAVQSPVLASTYWRQPALNDQKYLDDPAKPGQKIYLTGDLGRFYPDGKLEFLGRKDQMVKIRGFNVDLTGIEAVLRGMRIFKDLAVAAVFDPTGDRQVVAYLVADGSPLPVSELRTRLAEVLPDYMLPGSYIYLPALPMASNGKLDRQALPAPSRWRPEDIGPYQPPRSLLETIVADIWAEVLHIDAAGITDTFLDLGGQSLSATQIVARVSDALNVDLPQRTLFDAPTVSAMVDAIESARKITLEPILPNQETDLRPMSFGQQRLWFLNKLDPEVAPYNETRLFKLSGRVDPAILEAAFQAVIQRQASFRTRLMEVDGQPVQEIADQWEFKLLVINLTDSADAESRISDEINLDAHQVFDLERDLLIRARLFILNPEESRLVVTTTISCDNWSAQLLFEEIAEIYQAIKNQSEPNLPDLPIQYRDYAAWQRQDMTGEKLERQLGYWKDRLQGAPVLELPIDYPRAPEMTYSGTKHALLLDNALVQRLNSFNAREKTTRFMTLAAVFYVLLMRYSGQEDISLGIPIANRTRRELEKVIGFFVNTLVLRLDLGGNPSFRVLLNRLRETALEAYDHQEMPFDLLVDELHPVRSMQINPIFQVMFNYRRRSSESFMLDECQVTRLPYDSRLIKFDLMLDISESNDGLYLEFSYNTDLFAAASIERMAEHFLSLLNSVLDDPGEAIRFLPLISVNETHQLAAWNQTDLPLTPARSLAELFEASAGKFPHKTAIISGVDQLTYRELDEKAGRLAAKLARRGIGPEQIVAIGLERSPEMLAAILGILKSGAAYLPIDPNYPQERINFILEDSRSALAITSADLADKFRGAQTEAILIEQIDLEPPAQESQPSSRLAAPENLAYVLYTSGSTGKPKGVAIEHRSALAFMGWARTQFSLEDCQGVLASTSYCFDLSVFELLFPLMVGGSVILVENLFVLNGTPAANQVTLINTVPSLLVEFLSPSGLPKSTRVMNLAGEALPSALVNRIFQSNPGLRLYNLYGPTEDTTYSTCAEISAEISPGDPAPPIGRPIANSQAYVLDTFLQPMPIGLPGELHLAGAGLARGYINRPDLTEARFIQHSLADGTNKRMYKTGDLARYRPDGQLDYLGRLDHQVKLRGFRIELGEIESALLQHSDILQAAVLLREDRPGDKQLVAYITRRPEQAAGQIPLTVAALRSFLAGQLPDYMVPGAFVFLESFPLTSTGKLDRLALAALEASAEDAGEKVADLKPVEKVIAGILSETLNTPCRYGDDNFFELGGHSLLAIRATGKIREILRVELPVRAFMAAPTVSGLAETVLSRSTNRAATEKRAAILVQISEISELEAQGELDRMTFH